MRKIIYFLLFPSICFSLPGFHVNNTTNIDFSTMIGDQAGLSISAGKEINVPFGPMYSKCRNANQMDNCLLNIYDSSNEQLVAVIPFDPKIMTVVSSPKVHSGYDHIHFDGWDTSSRVKNITIYSK